MGYQRDVAAAHANAVVGESVDQAIMEEHAALDMRARCMKMLLAMVMLHTKVATPDMGCQRSRPWRTPVICILWPKSAS